MPRYSLLLFLLVYLAVAFVLPTYRVWKRTGVNPVTFRGEDTAHDYIGKIFKFLMLGLVVVVLVEAFYADSRSVLAPIVWLENDWLRAAGCLLLFLSLAWTVIAQTGMGNSWRIGLDEENKTDLVSSGLFGLSRNPIFLGMIVTLIGIFLVIPNRLHLCWVCSRFRAYSNSGAARGRVFR